MSFTPSRACRAVHDASPDAQQPVEEDLRTSSSTQAKAAARTLLLANFGQDGGPEPITSPISQRRWPKSSARRARVSLFMNKFRKLGFIEYNGHLEIHSSLLSILLRE
jgi:hypothetical protein